MKQSFHNTFENRCMWEVFWLMPFFFLLIFPRLFSSRACLQMSAQTDSVISGARESTMKIHKPRLPKWCYKMMLRLNSLELLICKTNQSCQVLKSAAEFLCWLDFTWSNLSFVWAFPQWGISEKPKMCLSTMEQRGVSLLRCANA